MCPPLLQGNNVSPGLVPKTGVALVRGSNEINKFSLVSLQMTAMGGRLGESRKDSHWKIRYFLVLPLVPSARTSPWISGETRVLFGIVFAIRSTNYATVVSLSSGDACYPEGKGHPSDPIWRPGSVKVIALATVHSVQTSTRYLSHAPRARVVVERQLPGFYSELSANRNSCAWSSTRKFVKPGIREWDETAATYRESAESKFQV